MFKLFIGCVVMIVGLTVIWFLVFKDMIDLIDKGQNKYKVNIGTKVLLNRDTLIVVDYSSFEEIYILSNGSKVSYLLLDSIKLYK